MDRERISITLRKGILVKLDRTIDGTKIRNRSHAIEYHLTKALGPQMNRAVILAGGPGTKMRPFTYEIPKALIPIHGRPLLEYTIDLLKKYQITNILISIGHLGDKIRNHFGSGERFGVNITYSDQKRSVGTAGALRLTRDALADDTFLLIHGDILVDIDLDDMLQFHKEHDGTVTLALTSASDPLAYGVVGVRRDKVVSFSEKPLQGQTTSNLINAGVYMCNSSIFKDLPTKSPCSLEKDIFPALATKNAMNAYVFDGTWIDVGTPESYEHSLKVWK